MNVSKNNKGFSLIELMVVVAIIGILATIAVPNFQKFQARSKQTNAKAELSAMYSAQKSFFAEYSTYSAYLPTIGYVPEGVDETLSYSPRAGIKRYYGISAGLTSTPDYGNLSATLLLTTPNPSFASAYISSLNLCTLTANPTKVTGITGSIASMAVGIDAFTAVSEGCPLNSQQPLPDVWWVNNNRVMTNSQSGL